MKIGLIREEKIPKDNRVALTPEQCKWIKLNYNNIDIVIQPSQTRSYTDNEYQKAGIVIQENLNDCDIILGIKEIPKENLIENKKYLFFSHTKKLQEHNQELFKTIIKKKITLIDYECLTHDDGTRILGFGFFAGIVGAHNGILCYGKKTNSFDIKRVFELKDFKELIHSYFGLKLPNIKIVVTGSGRVAHGILEIMNLMEIHEVEPDEYLTIAEFEYPVYVHLKGGQLYQHKQLNTYNRNHFHENPTEYKSIFKKYLDKTDILMNGVYWDTDIPRLFEKEDITENFRIKTIADITDDENGSIPINIGDVTIEELAYGVDKKNLEKTIPFLINSIDIMAIGNLPNEFPRDASRYFGEQFIKNILLGLLESNNKIIERATIVKEGIITPEYLYMADYGS